MIQCQTGKHLQQCICDTKAIINFWTCKTMTSSHICMLQLSFLPFLCHLHIYIYIFSGVLEVTQASQDTTYTHKHTKMFSQSWDNFTCRQVGLKVPCDSVAAADNTSHWLLLCLLTHSPYPQGRKKERKENLKLYVRWQKEMFSFQGRNKSLGESSFQETHSMLMYWCMPAINCIALKTTSIRLITVPMKLEENTHLPPTIQIESKNPSSNLHAMDFFCHPNKTLSKCHH